MNYNEEFISQTSQPLPPVTGGHSSKAPGTKRFWKKAAALVLSALIFGGAAGGAFYGLTAVLGSPAGKPCWEALRGRSRKTRRAAAIPSPNFLIPPTPKGNPWM